MLFPSITSTNCTNIMDHTWSLFQDTDPDSFINFIHLIALNNLPNDILQIIFHLIIKLTCELTDLKSYTILYNFIFKLDRNITYEYLCSNIDISNKQIVLQNKLFEFIMLSLSTNYLCCIHYNNYSERVKLQQYIGNNFPNIYKHNINCPSLASRTNYKSYCPNCNKLNKIDKSIDYGSEGPLGIDYRSTCSRCFEINYVCDEIWYCKFSEDYILSSEKQNLLILSAFQIKQKKKISYKNTIEPNEFNNILTGLTLYIINIDNKNDAGIKKFPNITHKYNINNMTKFKKFINGKLKSNSDSDSNDY